LALGLSDRGILEEVEHTSIALRVLILRSWCFFAAILFRFFPHGALSQCLTSDAWFVSYVLDHGFAVSSIGAHRPLNHRSQ
jgi:hypothetical protein